MAFSHSSVYSNIRLLPHLASREHDQKTQRIPIALLRVLRQISIVGQMLH
jgi:hypothetical protein